MLPDRQSGPGDRRREGRQPAKHRPRPGRRARSLAARPRSLPLRRLFVFIVKVYQRPDAPLPYWPRGLCNYGFDVWEGCVHGPLSDAVITTLAKRASPDFSTGPVTPDGARRALKADLALRGALLETAVFFDAGFAILAEEGPR